MNNSFYDSIDYVGREGFTQPCVDAIVRLIQSNETIQEVRLLTCDKNHGFLIKIEPEYWIAVRSGFASGYIGQGSVSFGLMLALFDSLDVDVKEYVISKAILDRLNNCSLTIKDMESIESMRRQASRRIYDYMHAVGISNPGNADWYSFFPHAMPLIIIDSRLRKIALEFWTNPSDALMSGYRLLEDIVRERIDSTKGSSKLFSEAFNNNGPLTWDIDDPGELSGRMHLFTGTYMTFRNPRAHRQLNSQPDELLSEFLLLNQLFLLESEAIERDTASTEDCPKESLT